MKNLYIFLWSLPAFIAGIAFIFVFNLPEKIPYLVEQIRADSVPAALKMLTMSTSLLLITILFSIPSIIKDLQYSMVQYILADNPDTNWKSALSKSKEMMVGNKWAYVKLMFSFTGWYIISNMVCCIGNLLLTPYIEATYAQMYIEISGQSADYSQYNYQNTTFYTGFGNM
jgi:uncharacterized membrane protein